MGSIFSRQKQQRSSKEILEELESSIKDLSERKRRNTQNEKNFVGYLLILSFFIYLIGLLIFYLYCFSSASSWVEGAVYGTPFVLFPLIVYCIKRVLNMFFLQRATQFNDKLRVLHEEKRKTLNEVMEKETYKTARELLQKYDPSNPSLPATPNKPPSHRSINQNGRQEVRRRRPPPATPHPAFMPQNVAMATPQAPRPAAVAPATPVSNQQQLSAAPTPAATPAVAPRTPQPSLQHIPPGMCVGAAPGPPTPCPILPRERSNMDKMVEYLVGDGPNNRYALICSKCKSHNGMALRDEFEYLTFRCAYCYHLNQARKERPTLERPPSVSEAEPDQRGVQRSGNHGKDQPAAQSRDQHRGQGSATSQLRNKTTPTPNE